MKRGMLLMVALLVAATAFAAEPKTFDATYTATVADVPAGLKELRVWIPLPASSGPQTVRDVEINSRYAFTRYTDPVYGNQYAFATIANPPAGDLRVDVRFTATRREETIDRPSDPDATRAEIRRALAANRLVTLSPRIRNLANQITAGKKGTLEQARAIYDYVVGTMKYDKSLPGWGNGDTERACDIKAGNCTDFHSLFLSLARAKQIPSRFVIGFPLTAKDGQVKGYHCWAEFYVKGKGWIPVDASEASKSSDPAKRQYFFGHLDPDRVQFTLGRDLVLEPRTSEPLNYFIYPRAEANGAPVGTPSAAVQFREVRESGTR